MWSAMYAASQYKRELNLVEVTRILPDHCSMEDNRTFYFFHRIVYLPVFIKWTNEMKKRKNSRKKSTMIWMIFFIENNGHNLLINQLASLFSQTYEVIGQGTECHHCHSLFHEPTSLPKGKNWYFAWFLYKILKKVVYYSVEIDRSKHWSDVEVGCVLCFATATDGPSVLFLFVSPTDSSRQFEYFHNRHGWAALALVLALILALAESLIVVSLVVTLLPSWWKRRHHLFGWLNNCTTQHTSKVMFSCCLQRNISRIFH